MKQLKLLIPLSILAMMTTAAGPTKLKYEVKNSFHSDYRATPRLLHNIDFNLDAKDGKNLAKAYVSHVANDYGIESTDMVLTDVKKSLLGTHHRYQQNLNGIEILNSQLVVSTDKGKVLKSYNNTYPTDQVDSKQSTVAKLSLDDAFDIAWADIRVHGKLVEKPSGKLVYLPTKKGFRLVYKVEIATEAPFGYWSHLIDAQTGQVVSSHDRRLTRKRQKAIQFKSFKGAVLGRKKAFSDFEKAQADKIEKMNSFDGQDATGSGVVFDPDPETTQRIGNLEENFPESAFEAAYFTRPLEGITFDGSRYHLRGRWVTLSDFESPNVEPSTSNDGNWNGKRDDVSFNDVMTYYHLDKSQKYMQSLGFTGERGIQELSIHVDANGVGGDDNSHFIPRSNRLAFGHGGVADNEDADVILHEYGHAINFSINNDWFGGDTGGMGEGFGDYWAGSYSIRTENGDFNINNVFTWDGHNMFWPGRRMDRTDVRYNHGQRYGAHMGIGNGAQSDELWSTPLFQSLLVLREMGPEYHANTDKIILEAHFGLGSGLKMRDMAQSIVQTARRLFPEGEYAQVFIEKFVAAGILEMPNADLNLVDVEYSGLGANEFADPGEVIEIKISLSNSGTHDASSVLAGLSTSTEGIEILSGEISLDTISVGEVVSSTELLRLKISDDFECGGQADLHLNLSFEGGATRNARMPISFKTGAPQGIEASQSLGEGLVIPDNDPTGVTTAMEIHSEQEVSGLKVHINLEHTYIGDLLIVLEAPSGRQVVLHNLAGGGSSDIIGTFGGGLPTAESLSVLDGEAAAGEWKLHITDNAGQDIGALKSWGLEAVSGYICDSGEPIEPEPTEPEPKELEEEPSEEQEPDEWTLLWGKFLAGF